MLKTKAEQLAERKKRNPNLFLSKAEFLRAKKIGNERDKKVAAYRKKLELEDSTKRADQIDKETVKITKETKIKAIEEEIKIALAEAADAEMNAVSPEEEKAAEELKKKVTALKKELAAVVGKTGKKKK